VKRKNSLFFNVNKCTLNEMETFSVSKTPGSVIFVVFFFFCSKKGVVNLGRIWFITRLIVAGIVFASSVTMISIAALEWGDKGGCDSPLQLWLVLQALSQSASVGVGFLTRYLFSAGREYQNQEGWKKIFAFTLSLFSRLLVAFLVTWLIVGLVYVAMAFQSSACVAQKPKTLYMAVAAIITDLVLILGITLLHSLFFLFSLLLRSSGFLLLFLCCSYGSCLHFKSSGCSSKTSK